MRGLRGATRKEQTREELLEAVRAERAARSGAKQKAKMAVAIQRAWRGYAARRRLRGALVSEWATTYGPMVALPDARLSSDDAASKLLPPLLFLLKPAPPGGDAGGVLKAGRQQQQQPSVGAGATAAGDHQAVLLLPAAGSPLSNMVRGSLALLLRTCTATDPRDSYLALALAEDVERGAAWREQAWRLLSTCCRLVAAPRAGTGTMGAATGVGAGAKSGGASKGAMSPAQDPAPAAAASGSDLVIDAAALRLAALLTDTGAWKCLQPGPSPQRSKAEAAVSHLRSRLAQQPRELFAALARLLALRQQQQKQQQQEQQQHQQQQQLSRLLGLVLTVLQCALDSTPEHQQQQQQQRQQQQRQNGAGDRPVAGSVAGLAAAGAAAAAQARAGRDAAAGGEECLVAFVQLVLVAPGAAALVPADMQARLCEPRVFSGLCRTVRQLLASRALTSAVGAAWCLSNLLQLLLGPYLREPQGAPAAAAAAGAGASRSRGAGSVGGQVLSPPPDSLWGGVGEVAGELAATAATLLEHIGGAGRLTGTSEMASAVSGWWPLAERGLLVPMLTATESRPGGVESYTDMCCAVIELAPRLKTTFAEAHVKAAVPGLLNSLAFSPAVLPRLWRWLCFALGLPRECPATSTRGLDVAALAGGYAGLPPRKARVLGLFCRVYAQLLLVLDDGEFYDLQQPMELAAARAVGTSLNSLVFHTYLPKPPADGSRALAPPAAGDPAFALLVEWAPRLLRALYERDVRRPYCQSLLWLAPYIAMFGNEEPQAQSPSSAVRFLLEALDQDPEAQPAGPDPGAARIGPFTAATILQSLVYSGADGEGDGGGVAADPEADGGGAAAAAAAPALQTKAGEGCRPSSVASLVKVSPQAVPFSRRVDLLRALLSEDKRRGLWDRAPREGGPQPITVTIHRSRLIEDAYAGLAHRGAGLKARLQVTFVNEAGMTEAGLDFGGLQKELMERVVSIGLDAQYGLFTSTPDGLAYPNPAAERLDGGLALLEFMGLMFGKALYEGILLPVPFAHFFIARLQGRQPLFEDLASLDPQLHRNLLTVKRYEGDVSDLGLTFSAETDYFGCPTNHELLPGGADLAVTNESRLLYCHLLADWHLNGKLGAPAVAFARGLLQLIPQSSLRLFNPREFNQLLSGAASDGPGGSGAAPLDVSDMRRWTRYSGGYRHDSTTVKIFWKVVSELSPAQQSALLRFVTSCSRPPLGGFRYLQPPLTLHKVECDAGLFASIAGRDVERLPSASTCYNMLKLPNYRRASTLKAKLLYSIMSGAGFELS